MRINGEWVGWGLGDHSLADFTVRKIKDFMRRMYRSYAGNLADTNVFDQEMYDAVIEMQRRLVIDSKLVEGQYIRGVLDMPTQIAMGYRKPPPPVRPIIFTVEGHLSDMFVGPCASVASSLEAQGVCHWKPIGYDCAKLPFNNQSGVDELTFQLSQTQIEGPPGVMWPFGTEIPWGIISFSQGAMIASDFMEQRVMGGQLAWRLPSFRRGLAFGNPRREKNKVCSWARSVPAKDTQGIMDRQFITTGTELEGKWAEHPNKGDIFTENTDDAAGKDKTAIARIVTENSWVGGQSAMFARVLSLFSDVPSELFGIIKAAVSGIMFLASNPNPHYSTAAEAGDINWMKGVAE